MPTLPFDESNIAWGTIEGFDHVWYYIYDVDEANRSADLIFKFAANQKIAPHRLMAAYRTLVLQGELRIYGLDGSLKEVRAVGSYIESAAGGEPHTERGGNQDTIVFFSNRNVDGTIYEILGPDNTVVATFGLAEFKALQGMQRPLPSTLVKAA